METREVMETLKEFTKYECLMQGVLIGVFLSYVFGFMVTGINYLGEKCYIMKDERKEKEIRQKIEEEEREKKNDR